ncbi:spermidine/putrescine ABC transporter permease [Nitrospira sp.]|nr:spermidine/putrescine ABC transporter permease [Nitrospira sp.]
MHSERHVGLWMVGGAALAFLYVPLAVMGILSFNDAALSMKWQGWTLKWYERLVGNQALWASLMVSLKVAIWSSLVATIVGLCAAVALERRKVRGLESTLLLPLVVPEIMMGVGFMLCFAILKVPLGITTVILAHAAFNTPLVAVLIRSRLRKLDASLEEAARDLGATPAQAFWRVTLPMLRPAILGAALLTFTVSLDDFLVTFFTSGPGATTLPLRVYSLIRSGVTPEINALSSVMVLASMLLVLGAVLLQRDRTAR